MDRADLAPFVRSSPHPARLFLATSFQRSTTQISHQETTSQKQSTCPSRRPTTPSATKQSGPFLPSSPAFAPLAYLPASPADPLPISRSSTVSATDPTTTAPSPPSPVPLRTTPPRTTPVPADPQPGSTPPPASLPALKPTLSNPTTAPTRPTGLPPPNHAPTPPQEQTTRTPPPLRGKHRPPPKAGKQPTTPPWAVVGPDTAVPIQVVMAPMGSTPIPLNLDSTPLRAEPNTTAPTPPPHLGALKRLGSGTRRSPMLLGRRGALLRRVRDRGARWGSRWFKEGGVGWRGID